jgi:hypothetical protein
LPGFERDIFVYNTHLIDCSSLHPGEAVEFELVMDKDRPQARRVRLISQSASQDPGRARLSSAAAAASPRLREAPSHRGEPEHSRGLRPGALQRRREAPLNRQKSRPRSMGR